MASTAYKIQWWIFSWVYKTYAKRSHLTGHRPLNAPKWLVFLTRLLAMGKKPSKEVIKLYSLCVNLIHTITGVCARLKEIRLQTQHQEVKTNINHIASKLFAQKRRLEFCLSKILDRGPITLIAQTPEPKPSSFLENLLEEVAWLSTMVGLYTQAIELAPYLGDASVTWSIVVNRDLLVEHIESLMHIISCYKIVRPPDCPPPKAA